MGNISRNDEEILIKLRLMISDKEIQKRRLYKIKTYDGKVKEVAWYQLPADRKKQILDGKDSFQGFLITFPLLIIVISLIFICIRIFLEKI